MLNLTDSKQLLAWIDLEMTGLDPNKDVILELAVILTNTELQVVAEGPHLILHQTAAVLEQMLPVVQAMHTDSGLVAAVLGSTMSVAQAEVQVLDFLTKHASAKTMPLCGNSVWMDKIFLMRYMPAVIGYLHYRIIDVSTIKELVRYWYRAPEYTKSNVHRAKDDIYESLAELHYYRQKYFLP